MERQIRRLLAPKLTRYLEHSRVVTLMGPRQAGKSTLVRTLPGDRSYATLDNPLTLAQAHGDPVGFISGLKLPATIDEVQKVPALLSAIKMRVDLNDASGQFLLTGSANLLTIPTLSESLAGRMQILELHPFAQIEIEGGTGNAVDALFGTEVSWREDTSFSNDVLIRKIVTGGYPEAVRITDGEVRENWFASYVATVTERDIRDIARITDIAAMQRIIRIIAARSSGLFSATDLASRLEMQKDTLQRYVTLLQHIYIVYRLPAWVPDHARRVIRAPKLFLDDSGLAAYELGINIERLKQDRDFLGGLFETFVVNELRKHASWSKTMPLFFHYRSQDGAEVDLLLETRAGDRVAIEIKARSSVRSQSLRALVNLVNDPKMRIRRGVVFYTGQSVIPVQENLHIVPVSNLWSV